MPGTDLLRKVPAYITVFLTMLHLDGKLRTKSALDPLNGIGK